MELIFFPNLNTRTRRAMRRSRGKFGRPYRYSPRRDLLENLAVKHGMTVAQVNDQLVREHLWLIKNP